MYEQRARCEAYIQHARALASFFDPKAHKVVPAKLVAPPELGELLKSCAWYLSASLLSASISLIFKRRHLYETGQLNSTLDILRVAFLVCLDKESLLYAHLCNTASSCYFDLNDLTRGRAYAKETLDIREKSKTAKSPEEEEDIANSYNNFGNFDCAAGDYKAAMVHFGRCEEIRLRLGKGLIIPLGILHLNVGRMLCRQKLFSEASWRYQNAEKIFLEVLGTDLSTWPELSSGYEKVQLPFPIKTNI
jgi:tetratricopeptide (TPR) repeat protein